MNNNYELSREEFEILVKLYIANGDPTTFDHKAYYSLLGFMSPYVEWMMGTALITNRGKRYVERVYWD